MGVEWSAFPTRCLALAWNLGALLCGRFLLIGGTDRLGFIPSKKLAYRFGVTVPFPGVSSDQVGDRGRRDVMGEGQT